MTNEQRYDNLEPCPEEHEWCKKHYVGVLQDDGSIKPCSCECHKVVPISAHPKFPKRQASRPIGHSYQGSE